MFESHARSRLIASVSSRMLPTRLLIGIFSMSLFVLAGGDCGGSAIPMNPPPNDEDTDDTSSPGEDESDTDAHSDADDLNDTSDDDSSDEDGQGVEDSGDEEEDPASDPCEGQGMVEDPETGDCVCPDNETLDPESGECVTQVNAACSEMVELQSGGFGFGSTWINISDSCTVRITWTAFVDLPGEPEPEEPNQYTATLDPGDTWAAGDRDHTLLSCEILSCD